MTMTLPRCSFLLPVLLLLLVVSSSSFVFQVYAWAPHTRTKTFHRREHELKLVDTTLMTAEAADSWRQYVPLVVSAAVIMDILLGSPMANAVMAPLRPKDTVGTNNKASTTGTTNPKERVDTLALANAAVERAKNTLELRRYLDENKTDWQKLEDIKKKMDTEMTIIDATLEKQKKELEKFE